jgi:hypothetical protein
MSITAVNITSVLWYNLRMLKRKQEKRSPLPPNVDAAVAIADVPVKIGLYHGAELLDEYDDVIDLEFNARTKDGLALGMRMSELCRNGLKTEDALFTIASEMVKAQGIESLHSLIGTELFKKASGHEIHVHVKRNGEIKFKMPYKG